MGLRLKDLIDVPRLQELTDHLYEAARIPSAIIAIDGEVLTGSGWQDICTRFHRKHPQLLIDCIASDTALGMAPLEGERFSMYTCPRGLTDACIPITIEGEVVGKAFAGQLFTEPPDESVERSFRQQAREFGLDEEAYMEAFRKIPVLPLEHFKAALRFLAHLAHLVADMGLRRLRLAQALEALQESEERFRTLVENSSEMISLSDENGRVYYVSPAVEAVTGYSAERFLGMDRMSILHPDDRQRCAELWAQVVAGEHELKDAEYRILGPAGEIRWLSHSARWLVAGRHAGGLESVVRNITDKKAAEEERQRLEEQLRQSAKMESLGRLAGGVAHDFNNLLTAISGNASLALEDLASDHTVRPALEDIARAAESASGLTRQLLAFSRKQVVQPRVLDVNELIADLRRMLERLLGEQIRLETSLSPELGPVLFDPTQFQQILVNLAVNARDAMPEGGVLTISTASLRAMQPLAVGEGQLPPGDYVLLTVADTGQGMSEEVRKRVFEPFFTTKEPGKGTGLGLPIVYGLMVQAGGFLTVTSDPGKGTVMRLHFPITSGIPEPLVGPQDGPSLKGTETILVAEDDSRVQKLVKAVLERLGYSVRMCSSGAEALAVASQPQESLDLLITDVIMPGLSGADLAREIKAIRPGLKILFMSGYTNDLISRHSVLDEGLSFLAKPFSPEVLGRKVREVLDAR